MQSGAQSCTLPARRSSGSSLRTICAEPARSCATGSGAISNRSSCCSAMPPQTTERYLGTEQTSPLLSMMGLGRIWGKLLPSLDPMLWAFLLARQRSRLLVYPLGAFTSRQSRSLEAEAEGLPNCCCCLPVEAKAASKWGIAYRDVAYPFYWGKQLICHSVGDSHKPWSTRTAAIWPARVAGKFVPGTAKGISSTIVIVSGWRVIRKQCSTAQSLQLLDAATHPMTNPSMSCFCVTGTSVSTVRHMR